MTTASAIKWNNVYAQSNHKQVQAADVLVEHSFLLPKTGTALDLACGLGANALLLAKLGLKTLAIDISTVALEKLHQQALEQGLIIDCLQQDIEQEALAKNYFDVIVVSRFLDRHLANGIIEALKTGGLLFYQTYTQDKISQSPPNNPDYLLAENELLQLFSPLTTRFYQEYGRMGNINQGNRNEALYIGQKIKREL